MGLVDGKVALIFGVANKNSIAWGITRRLYDEGATIALSYAVSFAGFNVCYGLLGLSVMWSTALAVPASTLVVFLMLNYRVFR